MALRRIEAMHKIFGIDPKGRTCAECQHLVFHEQSRKWWKCYIYGCTRSASSDWVKKWKACGMIDRQAPTGKNYRAIIRVLANDSAQIEQIDGQIGMFD